LAAPSASFLELYASISGSTLSSWLLLVLPVPDVVLLPDAPQALLEKMGMDAGAATPAVGPVPKQVEARADDDDDEEGLVPAFAVLDDVSCFEEHACSTCQKTPTQKYPRDYSLESKDLERAWEWRVDG